MFPSGNLVVAFDERARIDSRPLTINSARLRTDVMHDREWPNECAATRTFPPTARLDSSRMTRGALMEASRSLRALEEGVCGCTLQMDYSDVTLTNLTSGRVYRLEPISADSP